MLERTAASIESRNLQRVLATPARSAKRHRQLHKGFWQHGAAGIDLSSIWATSPRVPGVSLRDRGPAPPQAGLAASGHFLDFLYPSASLAALRRTHHSLPRSQDGAHAHTSSRRRTFASSTSNAEEAKRKPVPEISNAKPSFDEVMRAGRKSDEGENLKKKGKRRKKVMPHEGSVWEAEGEGHRPAMENNRVGPDESRSDRPPESSTESSLESSGPVKCFEDIMRATGEEEEMADSSGKHMFAIDDEQSDISSIEAVAEQAYTEARQKLENRELPKPSDLPDLLQRPEDERYYDIWDLYCRVKTEDQVRFRISVLAYLSRSRTLVETGRCLYLLPTVPVEDWNDDYLAAAVMTHMRSTNLEQAIEVFKTGLASKALMGGFEYLLSDALVRNMWPTVVDLWKALYSVHKLTVVEDLSRLDQLVTLPGLGRLYIAFEAWLSRNHGIKEGDFVASLIPGLRILRQKLAELALQQPCSPRQAAPILKSLRDHQLYHDYLHRIINHWQEKGTTVNMTVLPDIYHQYRQMEGFKPSVATLRGMCDLYYPHDMAGLDGIFRDWEQVWGSLDKAGYQKFLTLYSRAGDVTAVQTLWKRYIERYPEVIRGNNNMPFRSTMNVYAQTGDLERAQAEMEKMATKYKILPDLNTWNMMLKCCVRADDYGLALQCFDEICALHQPDSFTYTHIMAMAAKQGDMDKILALFTQAQSQRVPVTKQMVLPLVIAYCRNGKVLEAERICTELAGRQITSTDAWIELIRGYSNQGNLDKCYYILGNMKRYGIEWNGATYEALFQVLVKAHQVGNACDVLRRALKDRLFTVTSDHFAVVIAGATKMGDLDLARSLARQMVKEKLPMNFNVHVAMAEAAFKQTPEGSNTRKLALTMIDSLRSAASFGGSKSHRVRNGRHASSVAGNTEDLRLLRQRTSSIGRAIHVLIGLRELNAVEELVHVYSKVVPQRSSQDDVSQTVSAGLMAAYWREGQYDRVRDIWKQNFQNMRVACQQANGSIYPGKYYILTAVTDVLVSALREQRDGKAIQECLQTVLDAGFKLPNATWNRIVTAMYEADEWSMAVKWCEKRLMANWHGWTAENREQRERHDSHHLWPWRNTLLMLLSHWLEMRRIASWSAEASSKVAWVEKELPRLQTAFASANLENLGAESTELTKAPWVMAGKADYKAPLDDTLRALSSKELAILRRDLLKDLARIKPTKGSDPVADMQTTPAPAANSVEAEKFDNAVPAQGKLARNIAGKWHDIWADYADDALYGMLENGGTKRGEAHAEQGAGGGTK